MKLFTFDHRNTLMKQKLSAISVVGIVILLVSLVVPANPASAGATVWSAEPIPGTLDGILGPPGIDVRDIAVASGGTIIYAVPGNSLAVNAVYKSTSAGAGWTSMSIPIEVDLVAIAPDDDDMVAIASSSAPEVYLTVNGGSTWQTIGTPQEAGGTAAAAIYDIAISRVSDDIHYIAVAGKEAGDVANMWYFNAGTAAPAWKETNTLSGFSSAHEMAAVAFSPNFPSDMVVVAVNENDNVSVNLQILSLSSNKWNGSASFADYPLTIVSSSSVTSLASASIAMAPDYLASESDRRTVFVGMAVDGDTEASGIYRMVSEITTALMTGTRIHSVAFNGANLVAGRYDTTAVYRSANPLVTTPTFNTVANLKGPGGENKAVVAWADSKVVAGTSGNESAFAVSGDKGATFNDISLIDTAITNARDVAVSADGNTVYLVTDDDADLSLWRKVSTWERVLSQRGTTDYLVRIAPENADVIYVVRKGAKTIYYNKNGGEVQWSTRTSNINIQDMAVESASVVYILDSSGSVSKAINAGFNWGTVVSTTLSSGATIVSISTNNLLASSQDGYVAYSTDGSLSWTEISELLESGAGRVQVIADEKFASNKIIYAASDTAGQDIKKWQIGTSTEWTDIFNNTVPGGIYGLATDNNTLYALEFNTGTGQSILWRNISPTTASMSANWSDSTTMVNTDIDDTEVHLNATPRALNVSSGKLWAVKTNGTNKLYSFTDIMVKITLRYPATASINLVNPLTGIAPDIPFTWERSAEATEYELQIALDEDFTILITTVTIESDESSVAGLVGPHQIGAARVNFTPGTYYYWRVRATQPLYSLYSKARSFAFGPLLALVPELLAPANGSTSISRKPSFSWTPAAGASEYHFMLSANDTMTSPIVDTRVKNAGYTMTEELDYGHTYFWKVRASEPAGSDWSTLANFTVAEKPAEPAPPLIVQQAPPPVINMPTPPPGIVIVSPPPSAPAPVVVPDYLRIAIIMAAVLLLVVIALVIKPAAVRRFRVAEGFGERFSGRMGGIANYFKDFNPIKAVRGGRVRVDKTDEVEARNPISFAAESFLWMMTAEGKVDGKHLLSADEEQALGKTLASRIQNTARDKLLYQKFPKEAALFLHLWSRYRSRDETNRYLTRSFRSRPENVIMFLRCYLTAPSGLEPGASLKKEFSRSHYDSVAKVVDPANVYEALDRLYGSELDDPEDMESGASPDKVMASQFTHIHRLVESEMKNNIQNNPSD